MDQWGGGYHIYIYVYIYIHTHCMYIHIYICIRICSTKLCLCSHALPATFYMLDLKRNPLGLSRKQSSHTARPKGLVQLQRREFMLLIWKGLRSA